MRAAACQPVWRMCFEQRVHVTALFQGGIQEGMQLGE